MTISSAAYTDMIKQVVDRVASGQSDNVRRAADVIAGCVGAGGVVHAFGSGHSEALAMEIAGRAGGLVPTSKIALRDLVLYGGEPVEVLADPALELDPGIAKRLYDLAPVEPGDVFVIASNSGVNGVVVELALLVKERGHQLVAVTSLDHTNRVEPKHHSGRRLAEIADVVLDNGAPYGDAALLLDNGAAVGAVSSVTAAILAQQIVVEVVARLLAAGIDPPIYLSANVPGGREQNAAVEARYAGRIRRSA